VYTVFVTTLNMTSSLECEYDHNYPAFSDENALIFNQRFIELKVTRLDFSFIYLLWNLHFWWT